MECSAPIAVVGLAFHLPGKADSLESLEKLLKRGRSGYIPVPKDRWNRDAFYSSQQTAKGAIASKHGYFLQEDISNFDARFFQIGRHEACNMDPKQRLLLKTTYEALENAGIPMEDARGSNTSVFVSTFTYDFERIGYRETQVLSGSHIAGTGPAILANRVSYFFDLKGPSFTLDTGCSGGLVALHQACQSLRLKESSMAIASGVQLLLDPDQSVNMTALGMINPDGRCYAFDSRGTGYGRGEGIVALILKPLDQAMADGDHIHTVIVNSGTNQDGRSARGLLSPNGEAQRDLMRSVYAGSGLDPVETPFVEAHGTGTKIGDEEEISSIYQVFSQDRRRTSDIIVGSIKANLGHLEASAGLAGLLKAIVVLKTGCIPQQLNFENPKPALKLKERHIHVPQGLIKLPPGPCRASVNSFGYGGTNCHVIIESLDSFAQRTDIGGFNVPYPEHPGSVYTNSMRSDGFTNGITDEAPDRSTSTISNGVVDGAPNDVTKVTATNAASTNLADASFPALFFLTANSERSLISSAHNLQDWISRRKAGAAGLVDLAHTLLTRRSLFPWRHSIVASTFTDLYDALGHIQPVKIPPENQLTFVFTGQGAQWAGMGRELMAFPPFEQSLLKSEKILLHLGGDWGLLHEMFADEKSSKIGEARIAQPATTALQVALVDLLSSFRVEPKYVLGHSSGEIGAAYAVGALSHEAAIEVAFRRGIYSGQEVRRRNDGVSGSMLATGLAEADVQIHLSSVSSGQLCIACVNSPQSTTISGDDLAIDDLKKTLDSKSIFARKLKVDTAYHSHHMRTVANDYRKSLQKLSVSNPRSSTSFLSSVTSSSKTDGFTADYWVQNLVSPVRFADAMDLIAQEAKKSGANETIPMTFVEIGPSSALAGPAKQTLSAASLKRYSYLSALDRKADGRHLLYVLLGQLLEKGYPVDRKSIGNADNPTNVHKARVVSDLPAYSFDESPYWAESRVSAAHRFRRFPSHDLCGLMDPACGIHEPRWRHFLSLDVLPWLKDHVVDHAPIFPASGYIAMAVEAVRQLRQIQDTSEQIQTFLIDEVTFSQAISFPLDQTNLAIEVLLTLRPSAVGPRWLKFQISSYDQEGASWNENCSGLIGTESSSGPDEVEHLDEDALDVTSQRRWHDAMEKNSNQKMESREFYNELEASGNYYGPTFAVVDDVILGMNQGLATVTLPDFASLLPDHYLQPHVIHPTSLDAINHLAAWLSKGSCLNAALAVGKINDMVISANFPTKGGTKLRLATSLCPQDVRTTVSGVVLFQRTETGNLTPVLKATHTYKAFGPAADLKAQSRLAEKEVHRVVYQPDVDFWVDAKSTPVDAVKTTAFQQDGEVRGEIKPDFQAIERASAIFIRRAIQTIESSGESVIIPRMRKIFNRMKELEASPEFQALTSGLTLDEELNVIQSAGVTADVFDGRMMVTLGRELPAILIGKTNAQDLLPEDDLRSSWRANVQHKFSHGELAKYLEALSFKYPYMKLLEIGSHTCAAETIPLRTILETHKDNFSLQRYDIAGIDGATFLEAIQNRSAQWPEYVHFRSLDIQQDPKVQGFDILYDVIVASDLELGTLDLEITLAQIHRLLRPGGKLVLVEIAKSTFSATLAFGTLPDLPILEGGCEGMLSSRSQWDDVLRRNAFSGLENFDQGSWKNHAATSMMVTTAIDADVSSNKDSIHVKIIQSCDSWTARHILDELKKAVHQLGYHMIFSNAQLDYVGRYPTANYLVLDVADHALLLRESSEDFENLKILLTSDSSRVLWVALQESSSNVVGSIKSMIQGTSRVLRRENAGTASLTVFDMDMDARSVDMKHLCDRLAKIADKTFCSERPMAEPEYVYQDGQVLIPRLEIDRKFMSWVESRNPNRDQLATTPYHQVHRPLRLEVAVPGLLNSLRFRDDTTAIERLKPWEIQLSSRAHGVNFKDVFISLGQMPASVQMVGEVAGIVTAVGKDMEHKYRLGDRVMGFMARPFASMSRLNGYLAHPIPTGVDFSIAATIPCTYTTAYHCLFEVANLEKGQSILITAASGGVGQAAIQLAQYAGAGEIFVTLGSLSKKQLIMETYGIPESNIFSSRRRNFKRGIRRLTDGRGVDVVLNSLAGEMLTDAFDCVAELGTFCEIGKGDIYNGGHLKLKPFDRSVTFAAVDLVVLAEQRRERVHEYLVTITSLFEKQALRSVTPVNVFKIDQIEEAFRLIAGRKHTGKIVLESGEQATVKATSPIPSQLMLSSHGTYVIAGGLGSLGKHLAALLASRGAGHIVLLSRRAVDSGMAEALAVEMGIEKRSKLHVLQCDITQTRQVIDCAEYCKKSLGPVKGVIHSGMLLKDRPFTTMSVDEFRTPLGPKIYGTINMSESFASPFLEFFIMLSSAAAIIGNGSQANYTTANAFQDAFARANAGHPHTHYVALNLGAVEGSNAVASISQSQSKMLKSISITMDEFLRGVEYAMSPQSREDGCHQVILGISRQCIVEADDSFCLSDPLFSWLMRSRRESEDSSNKVDVKEQIRATKSFKEAQELIQESLIAKCASYLDQTVAEVPLDQPLSNIGIDSLLSIELKNWILGTFDATVHTAQISAARSLPSLSMTVTSQSKLIGSDHLTSSAA